MEDGPESTEGTYEYAGKTYHLDERDSEQWPVLDGEKWLGTIRSAPKLSDGSPEYTIDFAGEEGKYDEPASDDWRRAVEYIIDNAAPPVGA